MTLTVPLTIMPPMLLFVPLVQRPLLLIVDDRDFHSEECSQDYRDYFRARATRDFCGNRDLHSTACSHDNRDYFSSRAARDCCNDRDFNSEECSHDNRDYFPARDFRGSCDDRDRERFLAPELCVVDSSLQDSDISPVSRDYQPCDVWPLECTCKGTNSSLDKGTLSLPASTSRTSSTSISVAGDKSAHFTDYLLALHEKVYSSGLPNYRHCRRPVLTSLHIPEWPECLRNYHDSRVCGHLQFGWPVNYDYVCITQKRWRRRIPFGLKAWFNDYAKQNNNNNTRRMFTDFMQIWNNR